MNIQSQIDKSSAAPALSPISGLALPSSDQAPSMPLFLAKQGEKMIVRAIRSDKSQSRRLADLGLRVGKTINVIQKNRAGVVVGIQGLRLAIGPLQAKCILVEPT